jgi:hypothetical protein
MRRKNAVFFEIFWIFGKTLIPAVTLQVERHGKMMINLRRTTTRLSLFMTLAVEKRQEFVPWPLIGFATYHLYLFLVAFQRFLIAFYIDLPQF